MSSFSTIVGLVKLILMGPLLHCCFDCWYPILSANRPHLKVIVNTLHDKLTLYVPISDAVELIIAPAGCPLVALFWSGPLSLCSWNVPYSAKIKWPSVWLHLCSSLPSIYTKYWRLKKNNYLRKEILIPMFNGHSCKKLYIYPWWYGPQLTCNTVRTCQSCLS